MLAMPFSAIGAFLALTLTGTTLTILAMIGFIMLLGLVTKNSILLVDFANRSRAMTDDLNEAILRAGRLRLRPILMTSLTVILGSLPAAIGLGQGAGLRQGLATVVVGGMITSTLLTLVIIPVAYNLVESARSGIARWRERRQQRSEERKESDDERSRPASGQEQTSERRRHEARS
jgi:HAE1 family hydrophobic/amphiphilic exporter-1